MEMDMETLSKILAALIVGVLCALAALWGWNQLFGWAHVFEYSFWNVLGVLALQCFFAKVK